MCESCRITFVHRSLSPRRIRDILSHLRCARHVAPQCRHRPAAAESAGVAVPCQEFASANVPSILAGMFKLKLQANWLGNINRMTIQNKHLLCTHTERADIARFDVGGIFVGNVPRSVRRTCRHNDIRRRHAIRVRHLQNVRPDVHQSSKWCDIDDRPSNWTAR